MGESDTMGPVARDVRMRRIAARLGAGPGAGPVWRCVICDQPQAGGLVRFGVRLDRDRGVYHDLLCSRACARRLAARYTASSAPFFGGLRGYRKWVAVKLKQPWTPGT